MALVNAWEGAATQSSIRVVAKVTGTSTRLAVDTDPGLGNPTFFGPVAPNANSIVHLAATGLDPDTQYWWAVEDDGALDTGMGGQFRTHPLVGEPASFVISAAGDAGLTPATPGVAGSFLPDRISNHTIFDTVRHVGLSEGHLFHVNLGDIHYYNPGHLIGNTADDYRRCIDDVLLQPRAHELYRRLPLVHIWDDHDYGRNDSNATNPARATAWEVYREREPHYPLASDTEGVYHAFQVGRVLFVALDSRSFKTPKDAVDDAAKTMLGASQKAWLRSTLETSTAEALVVLQQTVWTLPPTAGDDSWGGYDTERTEVGQMFVETGWADRMIMVGADAHTLAMDTGASNLWGGFPTALFASLDASPSGTSSGYDLGISNARNQWGTIEITDTGEQITLTMTGYQHAAPWITPDGVALSHSIVIDTADIPDPGPGPIPAPPAPVAVARIRDAVNWLGIHRSTGRIICDLPDVTGETEQLLSAYATCQLGIPFTSESSLGHVPIEQILAATHGESGAIVAVVNDLPVWMGLSTARQRGSAGAMRLATATPESYLLKRYVHDHEFLGTDRALVAAALVGDAEAMTDVGVGLGFELDVQPTGELIDRTYVATDRLRVYEALQELAADGLEWRVRYDWADNSQTRIVKILELARRIGRISGSPHAMFETGGEGSVTTWHIDENWAEGKYANYVVAIGPGQGDDQPASSPAIAQDVLDRGAPIVEHVISPGRNVTDPTALDAHAHAELARVLNGLMPLTIEAALNAYPRIGVDALPGDQVTYGLTGDGTPDVLAGSARMAGWRMRSGATWTPLLIEDSTLLEAP